MSWVSDDGLHEGYAAYIVKDGREAVGTSAAGLVMTHGRWVGEVWESGEILPWPELLGWEARCDCAVDHTEVGPMWRVATTTPRNTDAHDPEEAWVGDCSATVEDCVQAWWYDHLATCDVRRRACTRCGCTDDRACVTQAGPCRWVAPELCSACATPDDLRGDAIPSTPQCGVPAQAGGRR